MIGMEVVRSTLDDDVAILSHSFYIGGYLYGLCPFMFGLNMKMGTHNMWMTTSK